MLQPQQKKGDKMLTPEQEETCVLILRTHIPLTELRVFRARIAKHGNEWSRTDGWRFHGGMHVRNLLRANGAGEEELGINNLEDVCAHLIELAVSDYPSR